LSALPRTPSQTVGPYLSLGLPWDEGPVADSAGVRIGGLVLDGAGTPMPDALVETWDPASGSFCRSATDDEGRWHVVTPEAPYLAVNVLARGVLVRLATRIYFALDETDPVLALVPADRRGTLVAERSGNGYRFDIRIQGTDETVFFDI
jgi:protocatechuate 3,4-dioxygenase alpha subunit